MSPESFQIVRTKEKRSPRILYRNGIVYCFYRTLQFIKYSMNSNYLSQPWNEVDTITFRENVIKY